MEILFFYGASCRCCDEFRPKVYEFAEKHNLKVTEVDIRDYEDPNRYYIGDIEGVPVTALKDGNFVLSKIGGSRKDDCWSDFEEKIQKYLTKY